MSKKKSPNYFAHKIARTIAANLTKIGAGQAVTPADLKQLKNGLPNNTKITVRELIDALRNIGLIDLNTLAITKQVEEMYLCNACGGEIYSWDFSLPRSRKVGPLFFCGQCAPTMAPSAQSTEEPPRQALFPVQVGTQTGLAKYLRTYIFKRRFQCCVTFCDLCGI